MKYLGFHDFHAHSTVSNPEGRTTPGYNRLALRQNAASNMNGSNGKEYRVPSPSKCQSAVLCSKRLVSEPLYGESLHLNVGQRDGTALLMVKQVLALYVLFFLLPFTLFAVVQCKDK